MRRSVDLPTKAPFSPSFFSCRADGTNYFIQTYHVELLTSRCDSPSFALQFKRRDQQPFDHGENRFSFIGCCSLHWLWCLSEQVMANTASSQRTHYVIRIFAWMKNLLFLSSPDFKRRDQQFLRVKKNDSVLLYTVLSTEYDVSHK